MKKKAFYSDEDIELAKGALAELPDLTPQRKTHKEFLDAISGDIITLVKTKGYTISDIKESLKMAGFDVSERALRDIIRDAEVSRKPRKPRKQSASTTHNEIE